MLVLDNITLNDKTKDIYVALGSFDGLHLGHLELINKAKSVAEASGGKSMVFTFTNHPRTVIKSDNKVELLMTNKEKIKTLSQYNVDFLAFKHFDSYLMKMSAEEFIHWLCNSYNIKGIIVGFNFRFGFKNLGDIDLLKKLSIQYNYNLYVIDPFVLKTEVVSSTKIRKYLLLGNVSKAFKLLSRPYSMTGTVVDGKKLGRTIGFPTANLSFEKTKIIPKCGVYYTNVAVEGKIYKGITSIGYNPTVNGQELTIETYILNFNKNIYNEEITVFFIKRIRDEIKFASLEDLITQLKKDKLFAEKHEFILNL